MLKKSVRASHRHYFNTAGLYPGKKPFVYVTVQEYIQNMSENSAFLKEKG